MLADPVQLQRQVQRRGVAVAWALGQAPPDDAGQLGIADITGQFDGLLVENGGQDVGGRLPVERPSTR